MIDVPVYIFCIYVYIATDIVVGLISVSTIYISVLIENKNRLFFFLIFPLIWFVIGSLWPIYLIILMIDHNTRPR